MQGGGIIKMEIKEMQSQANEIINKIDNKLNVKHDLNNTIIHLVEELGELMREIGKPKFRHEEINKEELGNELADVLIFLMRISELNNVNIEDAFRNKVEKLKERWGLDAGTSRNPQEVCR